MKLVAQPKKMLFSSSELLTLSRSVRQIGNEVENIEKNLRCLSELDECRYELRRQKESIELLTARLVTLSTSLQEITEMYCRVEDRNAYALEELPILHDGISELKLYEGNEIRDRVRRILKR